MGIGIISLLRKNFKWENYNRNYQELILYEARFNDGNYTKR